MVDSSTNDNYNQIVALNQQAFAQAFQLGYTLGQIKNLDNGIPRTNEIVSLTKGDTSTMARQKYHVELPSGDSVWVTGNTVSEAMANLLVKHGGLSKPAQKAVPTLSEFVEQTYYPTYIAPLRETTIANYEGYLQLNILPFLGNMRMDEISVSTIQDFYNWMATAAEHGRKKNLNRKTIERISGLLSRIFRVATEMKIIADTPIKKTILRNNGEAAGHHKALSDAEIENVKRAIPSIPDERERLYAALLAYTGMRREEICGLRWEYIHLAENYGEVFNTVTYPQNKKACINEGRGKTASAIRDFYIPTALAEIMKPLERASGYVCQGRTPDQPMSYSTMSRTYRSAYTQLGIKGKYNNHDMRTTFGSQLAESGMSAKNVADLLGQADTRMVETVYARRRREGILKQRSKIEELNAAYTGMVVN